VNVVVLYESMTGNTRRAAELIGGAAKLAGCEVIVNSVRAIDYHDLAVADLVFLGTWVDGLVLFGQRPGGGGSLRKVPVLNGKQVGLFMTYAVNAGGALRKFRRLAEANLGADVVAARLFKRNHLQDGLPEFVADALSAVPA
jgi:hypothetical protein